MCASVLSSTSFPGLSTSHIFPPGGNGVGGVCVGVCVVCCAVIYIVFLRPESDPVVDSLVQRSWGCPFRLSVTFQDGNLMFFVGVSSVIRFIFMQ